MSDITNMYHTGSEESKMMDKVLGWPAKSPMATKGAAMAIYMLSLLLVIVLVYFMMKKDKESYGTGSSAIAMQDSDQNYGFGREDFEAKTAWQSLAPTKVPLVDGSDSHGEYRLGTDGQKYYVLKDAEGNHAADKDGFLLYVKLSAVQALGPLSSAGQLLRTDWSDFMADSMSPTEAAWQAFADWEAWFAEQIEGCDTLAAAFDEMNSEARATLYSIQSRSPYRGAE